MSDLEQKSSRLLDQVIECLDKTPKEGFDFLTDEGHLLNACYNEINANYDDIDELQKTIKELTELVQLIGGGIEFTRNQNSGHYYECTISHHCDICTCYLGKLKEIQENELFKKYYKGER